MYVQTDENLHDIIQAEVVDDALVITTTEEIKKAKKCKIYITYTGITNYNGVTTVLYEKSSTMQRLDSM